MEIDTLIQQRKSELKAAFVAHLKTREAAQDARRQFSELLLTIDPESSTPNLESLRLAQAQLQNLELQERNATAHFDVVSEELAQLHRRKYGSWHITWGGPPRP